MVQVVLPGLLVSLVLLAPVDQLELVYLDQVVHLDQQVRQGRVYLDPQDHQDRLDPLVRLELVVLRDLVDQVVLLVQQA